MSEKSLAQKLLEVQRKIGPLVKDADNPFHKSKYADLNQVYELSMPELGPLDILVTHSPGKDAFGAYMETSLIDVSSNQSLTGKVYYSGNEDNMQKIGAAGTYAKRQGLKALLALGEVDDDGEEACGRGKMANDRPATQQPVKPPQNEKPSGPKAEAKSPVPAVLPQSFNREACEKKIRLTAKVAKDKKAITQEEADKMLSAYGVNSVSELNDDQAKKLLTQLEEKVK